MSTLPPWARARFGGFRSIVSVGRGRPLAQHNYAKKLGEKAEIKRVYFTLVRNIFFYQKTKQPAPMLYPHMVDT